MIPCILFEDEHLLVVNKPAGWNTHAPSPYAGEGLYDWLRHREPRWATLAIIHRLDKETSGVMVLGKTPLANRSLTGQFAERSVCKSYVLRTDRPVKPGEIVVKTRLARAGERYVSGAHGELAETHFAIRNPAALSKESSGGSAERRQPSFPGQMPRGSIELPRCEVQATPLTGRTHQIRVHAAEQGFPVLGDTLYGGTPWQRVCLHAAELTLQHPATGEPMTFRAPPDFEADPRQALRTALIEPEQTDAWRLIHGASDGWPGWYVDRLGDCLLSQSEHPLTDTQTAWLARIGAPGSRSAYHKTLTRYVRGATRTEASPQLAFGEAAPDRFTVRENGGQFELSLNEGYSVGLFLDQRDNRRRLLTGHVAAGFPLWLPESGTPNSERRVLNCFAYTCGFSVCAARCGARTTSLDLSKKYLEWGRRNFTLNGLDPAAHDFIYGDTFDWLRRLARKGRLFDLVLLDPPTFSQSKAAGVFRAEKDYGRLVAAALPVLKPGGVLFASTNAADWPPDQFLATVEGAIHNARRTIGQRHYVPQPPDFPISRAEPAYLKTVWVRVG